MSPINANKSQIISPLVNISKYSQSPSSNSNIKSKNKSPSKSTKKSSSEKLTKKSINNSTNQSNVNLTAFDSIGKKLVHNNISSPNKKNINTTNIFKLTSIEKSPFNDKLNYVDTINKPRNNISPEAIQNPSSINDFSRLNLNYINNNNNDDAIFKLEIELESRLQVSTSISSPENVYKVVERMKKLEKNKIEFIRYNIAAIKIQSITRGMIIRTDLVLLNQCAIKIQNFFRMKICLNNYLRFLYDLNNIEEVNVEFVHDHIINELNDDDNVYDYRDDDIVQNKKECDNEEVIEIIIINDSSYESKIKNKEIIANINGIDEDDDNLMQLKQDYKEHINLKSEKSLETNDNEDVVIDNIIEDSSEGDLFEEKIDIYEISDKERKIFSNIDNIRKSNNNSKNSNGEDEENESDLKSIRIQRRQYNSRQPMRHRRNTKTLFSLVKSSEENDVEEDEQQQEEGNLVVEVEEIHEREVNIEKEIEDELELIEEEKEKDNITDIIQLQSNSIRKSVTPDQLGEAIVRIQKLAKRRKTRFNDMEEIVTFSTFRQVSSVTPAQLEESIVKIQKLSENCTTHVGNKEENVSYSTIGQYIKNNNDNSEELMHAQTNQSDLPSMLSPIYKSNITNSTVEIFSPQAINAMLNTNTDNDDENLIPPPQPPLPIFQLPQEKIIEHETEVKKLFDELNQERNLRNELEIRLQEARMLLKILATGNHSNHSSNSDISSIDELESSLEGVAADFLNSSRDITRKAQRRTTWNNNISNFNNKSINTNNIIGKENEFINNDYENNQSNQSSLSTSPIQTPLIVINSQIEKESSEIIKPDDDILIKENQIIEIKEKNIKIEVIKEFKEDDIIMPLKNNILTVDDHSVDINLIKSNAIQSVSINDVDSNITTGPVLQIEPKGIEKESTNIIHSEIDVLINENLLDELNTDNNQSLINSESLDNISIQSTSLSQQQSSIVSTSKPKRKSNVTAIKSKQKRNSRRTSAVCLSLSHLDLVTTEPVSEVTTILIENNNIDKSKIENIKKIQSKEILKVVTEEGNEENVIETTTEKKIVKSPLNIKLGAAINSFKSMFAHYNSEEGTIVDDVVFSPIVNNNSIVVNEMSLNKEIEHVHNGCIFNPEGGSVFHELIEPNLDLNIKSSNNINNRSSSPFTNMKDREFRSISDAILSAENVLQQSPMKSSSKTLIQSSSSNTNENNIPKKAS
jgi:hypothetical protein